MRATPSICERSEVDVELGLTQTTSANSTTGVGDLLESGLSGDEVVDLGTEGVVLATNERVDNGFEDEGGVSSPSEEVVGVGLARTSDDYARLKKFKNSSLGFDLNSIGVYLLTLAPAALEPLPPMLASRPVFAMGDSVAM